MIIKNIDFELSKLALPDIEIGILKEILVQLRDFHTPETEYEINLLSVTSFVGRETTLAELKAATQSLITRTPEPKLISPRGVELDRFVSSVRYDLHRGVLTLQLTRAAVAYYRDMNKPVSVEKQPYREIRINRGLVHASQSFSLIEKRILLLALAKLQLRVNRNVSDCDGTDSLEVKIPCSELAETNVNRIKEAVNRLASREASVSSTSGQLESNLIFTHADYLSANGVRSEISLQIHRSSRELFLDLSTGFIAIDLDSALKLRSSHSIRMYELAMGVLQAAPRRNKWVVGLSELKSQLGLAPDVYNSNFSNFEKRVLDYCQSELQSHCDIRLDWVVESQARKKVTSLNLQFKSTGKDIARSTESATAVPMSNRRALDWITGDLSLLEE